MRADREPQLASGDRALARIAQMIGDVGGHAEADRHGGLALDLGDQRGKRLVAHGRQHVEAAAMHAANDHLRDAAPGRLAEQRLQQNDERLGATQPEQLAGRYAGAQDVLERIGARQLGQDLHALGVGRRTARSLGLGREPGPARRVVDMADVPADAAAVGGFQLGDARTCGGWLEAMSARIELRHLDGRGKAERVELRPQIAARAIGLDEGEFASIDFGVADEPRGCLAQHVRKAGLQRARIATADEGRVEVVGSHRSVHRCPAARPDAPGKAGNLGAGRRTAQRPTW